MCRSYELELWKKEIQYLKNYQKNHQWPSSSSSIHVSVSSFIETIQDHTIRQQLIQISEENYSIIQNLFNHHMAIFWNQKHALPIEQRLSKTLLNCIEQRFNIMNLKVDAIYCHLINNNHCFV